MQQVDWKILQVIERLSAAATSGVWLVGESERQCQKTFIYREKTSV